MVRVDEADVLLACRRLTHGADAVRARTRAGLLLAAHRCRPRHARWTLLLAKLPYLPLLTYDAPNLVSPRLRGWTPNVLDHHPGRYISIEERHPGRSGAEIRDR